MADLVTMIAVLASTAALIGAIGKLVVSALRPPKRVGLRLNAHGNNIEVYDVRHLTPDEINKINALLGKPTSGSESARPE